MVQEIAAITREGPPPVEYFNQFLQRSVSALDAQGGAIWLMMGKDAQLVSQVRIVDTEFESNPDQRADVIKALKDVLQNRRPMVVMPQPETPLDAGEEPPPIANRTPYPFFYIPLVVDNNCVGVLHVWQKPNRDPTTVPDLIKFLQSVATYAENYLQLRRLEDLAKEGQRLNKLLSLASALTGQIDTAKIAELVANHGRETVGCDRLAVLFRKPLNPLRDRAKPLRLRVASFSGNATVDSKSVLVKAVIGLCEAIVPEIEKTTVPPPAQPGQPAAKPAQENSRLFVRGGAGAEDPAASNYFTESNLNSVIVAPIRTNDGMVVGAIIAESTATERVDANRRTAEWVAKLTGQTMTGAIAYQTLPLRPMLEKVQKLEHRALGPKRRRFWTVTSCVVGVLAVLCALPMGFKMDGECVVLPTVRSVAVFETSGRISEVFVDEDSLVKKGDVLAKLDDRDLKHDLAVATQDALRYQAEIEKYRAAEDEASRRISEINSVRAQRQVDQLQRQIEKTELRSPIDGVVASRDLKLLVGVVVQIGNQFCELLNRDNWELDVQVRESDISYVDRALRQGKTLIVRFILNAQTSLKLKATVSKPEAVAQVATPSMIAAGSSFIVRGNIEADPSILKQLKPGYTGKAAIDLGYRPAVYVLFRRFVNWVRVQLFI